MIRIDVSNVESQCYGETIAPCDWHTVWHTSCRAQRKTSRTSPVAIWHHQYYILHWRLTHTTSYLSLTDTVPSHFVYLELLLVMVLSTFDLFSISTERMRQRNCNRKNCACVPRTIPVGNSICVACFGHFWNHFAYIKGRATHNNNT